jgi:shikimate dehydrogenase
LGLAGAKKITIVNRSEARGKELFNLLRDKLRLDVDLVVSRGDIPVAAIRGPCPGSLDVDLVVWRGDYRVPDGTDIVINATSIGLYDAEARLNLDMATLQPGTIVADVIGNPPRTRLIYEAEARGCRAIDGLGMLVNQGVVGVQYWTGIEPDAGIMRQALEQALGL